MDNRKPRSYLLLALLVVFGMVLGTLGGGVAGYVVATNANVVRSQPVSAAIPVARVQSQPAMPQASTDAPALSDEAILTQAVQQAEPATVTVVNTLRRGTGEGSGVIIDNAGHIVTNNHVVDGARSLEVIFNNGKHVPATLVGTSPDFDLAVIKVDGDLPGFATFGDSSTLRLGSQVVAIGSALGGFRNTVTGGIVSGFNRSVANLDGLIQTDAAINHGNSGGPLINMKGQVIGINTLVVRDSTAGDQAEGLGFAIPSNLVKSVVQQLIETGKVDRPYIGITFQPVTAQLAQEQSLKVTAGAYLSDITANSPASQAGLKTGDVIVSIGGQALDDEHTLTAALLGRAPGDTLQLKVLRGSETLQIELTLGKRPAS
jgi:2-alkenal reductase